MKRLPQVVSAKYLSDFTLDVKFDDGIKKAIDFSAFLKGPVFKPLKNKIYFKKFIIEGGTIGWPNGADIAPETLYSYKNTSKGNKKSPRTSKPTQVA